MRHMTGCLFTVVSFLAGFSGAAGAVQSEIVGVWQLVSYSRYSAEENKTTFPFGANPAGYLIYTASGYMSIVVTGEGRPAVSPTDNKLDEKQSKLFATMIAYSGTYKLDGDKVTHHLDVAWHPTRAGADQTRYIKVEGDTLSLRTPPFKSLLDGKGKEFTDTLNWRRAPANK